MIIILYCLGDNDKNIYVISHDFLPNTFCLNIIESTSAGNMHGESQHTYYGIFTHLQKRSVYDLEDVLFGYM